jgi:CubicO group peptidase (beta-lactamase class C family)
MNHRRLAVLLLASALAPPVAARAEDRPAPRPDPFAPAWKGFETAFRAGIDREGIVGGCVALASGGRVAASACHGLRDRDGGVAADLGTIFHWASITKTLTAIAILQLRDRGLLALDDPAVKYLPELRAVHDPFGDIAGVTLRHLLSHGSGFRGGTWPWGGDKDWHPFEPRRYEQIVAMLPYTAVEFAPGSRFSYSNLGYVFLGRILEQLTGDDYEVYVDKNVLRPLGMHESYFDRAPYHLRARRSHSYERADGALHEAPFDFDTGVTVSNGGLMAPIDDMVKYLAFLIGEPARPEHEGVLKRSTLREMWQPQLAVRGEDAGQEALGLGFFLERRLGRALVGHSGGQGGFISHLYLDPAAGAGYVVAFNTDARAGGRPLTRELDAQLRDRLLREVWPALALAAGK